MMKNFKEEAEVFFGGAGEKEGRTRFFSVLVVLLCPKFGEATRGRAL
jgi:hypothetical protein